MYHRIAEETFDPWALAVSPGSFARQLEWLAANRLILPLEEFAERKRDCKLPANAVALTFDDGYACALETAGPILNKLAIAATVFLPVELLERGQEFWWDDLQRLVLECRLKVLHLDGDNVSLGERSSQDRVWPPGLKPRTPRQRAYLRLWSNLYERPDHQIAAIMQDLRKQDGQSPPPRPSHRLLNRQDLATARPPLMSFGAHGLSHASLPKLTTSEVEREIGESVSRCAALTGQTPRTFAYPFGDFNAKVEQLVSMAGYTCACSSLRAAVTKASSMFALPRLAVGEWEPAELKLRLAAL